GPEAGQRRRQHPRNLHLADAESLADLRLAQPVAKAQHDQLPVGIVEVRQGGSQVGPPLHEIERGILLGDVGRPARFTAAQYVENFTPRSVSNRRAALRSPSTAT